MRPSGHLRSAIARLRDFRADRSGVAAVEFALVVGPFLLLLFAVLELAMVFLLSTSLDAAADGASREIRTGVFQTANKTGALFKQKICDDMTWFATGCTANLTVDARVYDTFAQISDPLLTTNAQGKIVYNKSGANFLQTPAGPKKIVVVRSYYEWPLLTPFMEQALARVQGSNKALITSVQVFQTEPYQP